MIEQYEVTLTDANGPVRYEVAREDVGRFISGINWETVQYMRVEPVEPLADWEKAIVADAEWEKEIIAELEADDAPKLYDVASLHPTVISMDEIEDINPDFDITLKEGEEQEDDWWDLYGLIPTHAFEINHEGTIRIKATQKVLEPTFFDIDRNDWNVLIKINGMEYYLDGKRIAAEMKKEA